MSKIVLLLLLFLNVFRTNCQENTLTDRDIVLSQFNIEFKKANVDRDFRRMTQLLCNPEIKERLDEEIFAAYFVQLTILSNEQKASSSQKKVVQKSIIDQSKDSTFQTQYATQLFRDQKYEYLESYLNNVEDLYYDHLAYLQMKALTLERLSRYDKANAINNKVLKMDEMKRNAFTHYSIGYAQFRYGTKIYESGKNRKKADSYINKSFSNLRKGYDLCVEDKGLKRMIGCSINDFVNYLANIQTQNLDKFVRHFDGMESLDNSITCFPSIHSFEYATVRYNLLY